MNASIILLIVIYGLTKAMIRDHVFVNIPMNWTDAQRHCRTVYKDLSTIASQEEQDILMHLSKGNAGNKWIGLYRNKSDIKQFLWSDGDLSSFSKWDPGQPNNYNGFQYCVSITNNWFDYECYNLYPFFCYKNLTLVKEMRSWEEALQYCRTQNTDLATLNTDIQLELAKNETNGSQTDSVWTGLRYLVGKWFWVSNATLNIQTSLPECPAQNCRCAARNTKTDRWENRDCTEKLNFLCHGKERNNP